MIVKIRILWLNLRWNLFLGPMSASVLVTASRHIGDNPLPESVFILLTDTYMPSRVNDDIIVCHFSVVWKSGNMQLVWRHLAEWRLCESVCTYGSGMGAAHVENGNMTQLLMMTSWSGIFFFNDDIKTQKPFGITGPLWRGIHRWPLDSHPKEPVMQSFDILC